MTPVIRALGAILIFAAVPLMVPAARAANCGGPTPCACGDVVTVNHTLTCGVDPVTLAPCTGNGLTVAFGVTLHLGGCTIRGSGGATGTGLLMFPAATAGNGVVREFQQGVAGRFVEEVNDVRLHDIHVIDNAMLGIVLPGNRNVIERSVVSRNGGFGIQLIGNASEVLTQSQVRWCRVEDNQGVGIDPGINGSIVESNIVRRNTQTGIEVTGDANQVVLNRVESNGGQGISAGASLLPEFRGGNTIARNIILRNGGDGVEIAGELMLLDRNQSKYNGGQGFRIDGGQHTLVRNIAVSNEEDGFTVSCDGCRFDRNRADFNGRPAAGFGILDSSSGGGISGIASTYIDNVCTGNGLGNSSPAGLCR